MLGGPDAVRICLIFSWFPIKQPNIKHIRQRQGGTGPGLSSLQEKEKGERRGRACRGSFLPAALHPCAPARPALWGCCSVGSRSVCCNVGPLRFLWDPLGSGGQEGSKRQRGWNRSRAGRSRSHGAGRLLHGCSRGTPTAAPYLPGSGVSAAAPAPSAAVYNRAQPHSVGGCDRREPRPHTWPRSH